MNENEISVKLRKVNILFLISVIAIIIAVTIPTFAHLGLLKPAQEPLHIWFQRSGSLMIIICVALDTTALVTHSTLNYSWCKFFNEKKKFHIIVHRTLTVIAIILTVLATFIWGYGDLIFNV